jgi:hypothetical protein
VKARNAAGRGGGALALDVTAATAVTAVTTVTSRALALDVGEGKVSKSEPPQLMADALLLVEDLPQLGLQQLCQLELLLVEQLG